MPRKKIKWQQPTIINVRAIPTVHQNLYEFIFKKLKK